MSKAVESPLVAIEVSSPEVDRIVVYREHDGWKINASKDGEPFWPLQQHQDEFSAVIQALTPYVTDASVWWLDPGPQKISAWTAMTLLADSSSKADTMQ